MFKSAAMVVSRRVKLDHPLNPRTRELEPIADAVGLSSSSSRTCQAHHLDVGLKTLNVADVVAQ